MKKIKSYREVWQDKHKGETCLIVANGPSLKQVPLEALKKYPSFGCNRIHFRFDEDGFAPTYYCSLGYNQTETDEQREHIFPMLEQCEAAFINKLWVHAFPFDNIWGILGPISYGIPDNKKKNFSYDPFYYVGISYTMTYVMLQMSYYMGFEKALIVGMDGTYEFKQKDKKHFYSDKKTEGLWETAPGPHTNKEWQDGCNQVFGIALHAYRMGGREIINLNPKSKVTMFPREDWREWLS